MSCTAASLREVIFLFMGLSCCPASYTGSDSCSELYVVTDVLVTWWNNMNQRVVSGDTASDVDDPKAAFCATVSKLRSRDV